MIASNRISEDYKDESWLRDAYITKELSRKDIGNMCGVHEKTVSYYTLKFSIPSRRGPDRATNRLRERWSESRKGRPTWNAGLAGNYAGWAKHGIEAPGYKGGTASNKGYTKILSLDHPHRDKNNYVFEHRLVCEELLGRYLTSEEVVHHRDKNPLNNSPENLFIFYGHGSHFAFHHAQIKQPNLTEEEFCRGEDY